MDRAQRPSSEEEDDDDDDEEAGSSSNDESSSVAPQRDVDGPEVKPLRAARAHCNDVHGYRNDQPQQPSNVFSEPSMPSTSSSSSVKEDVDAPAGGRLRFFFAGRCVLELAHDTDGRGRPKQWTQTATSATSPRPTTWIPSASTSGTTAQVLQHEKVAETALPSSNATLSPASSSSSPVEETTAKLDVTTPHEAALGRRGSFLPFTILRRSAIRSSPDSCTRRPAGLFAIGPTLLRRAARRPFRLFQASIAAEDSQIANARPASRQKRILAQKMQRLDWLAHGLLERSRLALSRVNEAYVTPPGSSAPHADLLSRSHPEEADTELALKLKLPTSVGPTVPIPTDAELQELMKRHEKRDRPTGFDSRRERRRLLQQHRRRQQQQQHQHLNCSPQTCQVEEKDSASQWNQNLEASNHHTAPFVPLPPPLPPPPLHLPSLSSTLQRPSQRRGARGRTIGEAVRNFVIHEILDLGGDPRTKYVPRGVFTEVGLRHKVDATTTYRWWLKYCNSLRASLDQADASSPPNLNPSTEATDRRGRPRSASYFSDATVPSEFLNRTAVSERILSTFTALNPISSSTSPTAAAPAANVDSASVQTAAESRNAGWPPPLPALLPLSSSSSSPPSSILPFQQHQQQQHQHDNRRRHHHHRRHRFSNDATVPSAMSSDRSHPTTTLPIGVCLPYVWNGATTSSSSSSSVVNKLQGRIASNSSLGYKTLTTAMASDDQVLDEPLDLTIPKKKTRSAADDNEGDEGLIDLSPFKPVVLGERVHVAI